MNEQDLGQKVARLLNASLDDLDQDTLDRLKAARMKALENTLQTEAAVTDNAYTGTVSVLQGGDGDDGWNYSTRKLVSLILLLLALAGVFYWQTARFDTSDTDEDEVDMLLLVDDLPVDAYLDDEMDTWLNHS